MCVSGEAKEPGIAATKLMFQSGGVIDALRGQTDSRVNEHAAF